jgi:hypothetical protein
MYPNVEVKTWAGAFGSAKINYTVDDNGDTVDFMFGAQPEYFEFGFDAESLRRFVTLANEALRVIEARQAAAEASPS